ncbi:MAG: class I SAM-dependent methyltransferase, partial [Gammaproteobacteria bacterium]|nr:class I SAM-dependent methyltransferase [Gammaproteobacteria bacterium]
LQQLIDEFGQFDIIIDDGSHMMEHMRTSFDFLYPTITKNGLYIIEDTHTCYWPEFGGGTDNPETFINYSKGHIDALNAFHSRDTIPKSFMSENTFGIYYYDSVVVYERGTIPLKKGKQTGEGAVIY